MIYTKFAERVIFISAVFVVFATALEILTIILRNFLHRTTRFSLPMLAGHVVTTLTFEAKALKII